ncbi:hypothetical protein GHT06_019346 [Daphnia sinensis]|uniref:Uncharacterized protein n=1 Tax=Daphnia sinensis TaxID=1820382 RepID=A0AAD5KJY6_9CRUS|nr:hypothetical protein GHT06_019346 [Daphnia sinensis]
MLNEVHTRMHTLLCTSPTRTVDSPQVVIMAIDSDLTIDRQIQYVEDILNLKDKISLKASSIQISPSNFDFRPLDENAIETSRMLLKKMYPFRCWGSTA